MRKLLPLFIFLFVALAHAADTTAAGLYVVGPSLERPPVRSSDVELRRVKLAVEIEGLAARSTVETVFENHTNNDLMGVWTFPLPPNAAADRLALTVNKNASDLSEGTMTFTESAESIFKTVTAPPSSFISTADNVPTHFLGSRSAGAKDPGVLTKLPNGLYRLNLYPIEKNATKTCVVSALQPLQLQTSAETVALTYTLPLGAMSGHLARSGRIYLSARIHDLPLDATVSSTLAVSQERQGGDVVLTAQLSPAEPATEWKISITQPKSGTLASECILQAHRSTAAAPGVFALTLQPHCAGDTMKNPTVEVWSSDKRFELTHLTERALNAGASTTVYGEYDAAGSARVTLRGTVNGQPYVREWNIDLPQVSDKNASLLPLYAAARGADLSAKGDRYAAALLLGRHRIVGVDTALLVLDTEKRYRLFRLAPPAPVYPSVASSLQAGVHAEAEDFEIRTSSGVAHASK